MTLRLYNTLSKSKDVFAPLDPKNVRIYVCGPTVYDFAHIGNARPVIVFDVLFRLLRHLYGDARVTYVRNITDVDDKINARAAERGISIRELTEETAEIFNQDVAALNCLPPTVTPRATEHIAEMVAMIQSLIASGNAYVAEGHVLFDVASKLDYGKLARRSLDEMVAGARVEVAPYKKDAMDFVLWKPSKPGEPGWDSPWGRGRPGWHIECSAMAGKYLGQTFDIHGGGIDLVFPHHENEIAQSECAHHGAPLANVWMHNGFLQVEGEKMSKSAGNFFTIHELLENYPGGALRLAMLQTHYKQPINWTQDKVEDALSELRDWAGMFYGSKAEQDMHMRIARKVRPVVHPSVQAALEDDLNTSDAITALRALFKESDDAEIYSSLIESCEFLGLFDPQTIGAYFRGVSGTNLGYETTFQIHDVVQRLKVAIINRDNGRVNALMKNLSERNIGVERRSDGDVQLMPLEVQKSKVDEIGKLLELRAFARKNRDFKEADRIRDELKAKGIEIRDNPDGSVSVEVR